MQYNENESVLNFPLMSFEEFGEWYASTPLHYKVMLENVTKRDMLLSKGKISVRDIYDRWYLERHFGSKTPR